MDTNPRAVPSPNADGVRASAYHSHSSVMDCCNAKYPVAMQTKENATIRKERKLKKLDFGGRANAKYAVNRIKTRFEIQHRARTAGNSELRPKIRGKNPRFGVAAISGTTNSKTPLILRSVFCHGSRGNRSCLTSRESIRKLGKIEVTRTTRSPSTIRKASQLKTHCVVLQCNVLLPHCIMTTKFGLR